MFTVKYRKDSQWFWRTVKNVKREEWHTQLPYAPRILILDNDEHFELPSAGTEFWFSKEHRGYIEGENAKQAAARTQAEMEKLKEKAKDNAGKPDAPAAPSAQPQ